MRSFEEIDRDMAGVTGECVRRAHGCTYPACQCPRPEARSIAAGAAAPSEGVKPLWQQHEDRIKELMAQAGFPNSMALFQAFKQFATEFARPSALPVSREFVNELGNRVKITIEGPTSTSENILTPMEGRELHAALSVYHAIPPSADEWFADCPGLANDDWRGGWEACRNRVTHMVRERASPSLGARRGSAGAMQQPVMTLERKQLIARQLVGDDPVSNVTALRIINAVLCDLGAFASPLGASAGDAGATDTQMLDGLEKLGNFEVLSRYTLGPDGPCFFAIHAAGKVLAKGCIGLRSALHAALAVDAPAAAPATCGNTPYDEGPFTIAVEPAQQSDSVHSSAPGADVGKTLENAPGAGGSVE